MHGLNWGEEVRVVQADEQQWLGLTERLKWKTFQMAIGLL